jgi:hypothetical protein
MAKKTVTRYSLPLTDAERDEIKQILTPVYEAKERRTIANALKFTLLKSLSFFLTSDEPKFDGSNVMGGIEGLKKQLQEDAERWYANSLPRLTSDIRPEDIFVTISTDGLYILKYSDTVKQIITKADFGLQDFVIQFPFDDSDLVDQVNKHLEEDSAEE